MQQTVDYAREGMKKALSVVADDLATIRSGRATPALVEHLVIPVYQGSQRLKLKELATITTQDAKTLLIAPFDPSIIKEIEKGIFEANIGLTPVTEGEYLRISIPPLSEERRQEYVRLAKTKLEAGKVMVRQVRQDAMKDLKKKFEASEITEDQKKHGEKLVQELTDEMVAEIESLGEKKTAELITV